MDDKDVSGKMNRATMEALAEDILQRAKQCMLRLLQVTSKYILYLKTTDMCLVLDQKHCSIVFLELKKKTKML